MTTWRASAVLLCGALAVAVVACDGGDGDLAFVARETPEATSTVARTATLEPDPTAATGLERLRAVEATFRASTFSATYESRAGSPLRFEISKDPTRFRLDVSGEREGAPYSAITILSDDGSYACFTGAQAEIFGQPPEGACAEITNEDENPLQNVLEVFTVDDSTRLLETSERTIAGRTAACYRTANAGVEGTVCVDANGVLLAIESADATAINVAATAVTDTVSDSDFAPPYEVRDVPGFGGQ